MNDWDRFTVTMRLSAAEQELARRAQRQEKARVPARARRIELVLALALAAVLATPILFMVLR